MRAGRFLEPKNLEALMTRRCAESKLACLVVLVALVVLLYSYGHPTRQAGFFATSDACRPQPPDGSKRLDFSAQAGQDELVWRRWFQHRKCGQGTFIEFGARDGRAGSNTRFFEASLGWRGLLFEPNPAEFSNLKVNRPGAYVYTGAVCPRDQHNLTLIQAKTKGWSGSVATYDAERYKRESGSR